MKNCISRRSFLKAAGILGAAGALAACGGSWICEPSLIQSSEWEEIGRRTREALRAL